METCKECNEKEVNKFGQEFCSVACMKQNKRKQEAKTRTAMAKRNAERIASIR